MFVNCLEDNFHTQHAREVTRNESVLDLVITCEPYIIQEIEVLRKFAISDHNLLHWSMDIMVNCEQKKQAMQDFKKANFETIKSELNATDWDLELHRGAIESLEYFRKKLDNLIAKYIPLRSFKTGQKKKALWLSNKAVKLVNKKHKVYHRYKINEHPAYKKAAKEAKKKMIRSKREFEKKLSKEIKKDTKSFFAYIRSRSKSKVKIGPLISVNGEVKSSPVEMSEELN